MEISDRDAKVYYSEPMEPTASSRPRMPLPGEVQDAPTKSSAEESGDTYMHPGNVGSSADNHVYSAKTTDDHVYSAANNLQVEDPYDYCQPENANPTLSFRREAVPTPVDAPESPSYYVDPTAQQSLQTPTGISDPESPPYYVDPIPDMYPNGSAGPQYHTLEPLAKK